MVKWTGKLVVFALALSLWASPLMACMLSDSALTAEERECCKKMADQCGQMEMPASHSCCKVTVHQTDPFLINPRFVSSHSQVVVVPLVGRDVFSPASLTQGQFPASIHSPPVSPTVITSILRI